MAFLISRGLIGSSVRIVGSRQFSSAPVSSLHFPSVLFNFPSPLQVRQFSSISSLPLFSRHEARLSYNIAEYKKASHMSHDNIFKCHIIVTVRVSICDRPECCRVEVRPMNSLL
eukprot:scaffold3936_cov74-Skeletonema_dohrnii-CCMP3373.AAC.1